MPGAYQVGAYCFPNYHVDPRNEAAHGRGWTEWELVRRATPRFPGHCQPRVPLWGYEDEAERAFSVPYFPNVTVGWDSTPRTVRSDVWEPAGYPYTNLIGANPPEAFARALEQIRARIERTTGPRILNINSWNELTEGSCLEPDTVHGMGYLEAVGQVFGSGATPRAGG